MFEHLHQLGVQFLVDADQRGAVQRIDPVADAGRQADFLARDEVFGQPSAATTVDLHMTVHRHRQPLIGDPGEPLSGEAVMPLLEGLGGGTQGFDLAPQGLDFGAAVQAEQPPPLAGGLVAQGFEAAGSGQGQEREHQQDGGQTIKAGRQFEQHGQCREYAAMGHRPGRFVKAWHRRVQQADGRQLAAVPNHGRPARRRVIGRW